MRDEPSVSVVIPTIGRPELVRRAVRSVLDQSVSETEVVVVIDGPDDSTVEALGKIDDCRLRVCQLSENGGMGAAVNAGAARARARWVALLDDDDEWLPQKLEVQLAHARRSSHRHPIVACRFIARTEAGDLVWPRRDPEPQEPLSEYLFCQRGPRGGEGAVLPSGILTTRALLHLVPWRVGLPRLNDFDWLLRAVRAQGAGLEFVGVEEPLVIYNRQEAGNRISTSADWRYCQSWIRENRELVTARVRRLHLDHRQYDRRASR